MFFPDYKECDVKTTVKQVGDGEDARFIPDLPIDRQPYTLVYCDGVNYYAYPLPKETLGKECICHVVYFAEDDKLVQRFKGLIGIGNEVCKTPDYKSIITTTVADVKIAEQKEILIADASTKGETVDPAVLSKVDYKGTDALDGYPVWAFLTTDYRDK